MKIFNVGDKVMLLEPPVYSITSEIKAGDVGVVCKAGLQSINGKYYSVVYMNVDNFLVKVSMYDDQIVVI